MLAASRQEDAIFLGDLAVVGEQQLDVRLRLFPPGGQQLVADLVVGIPVVRRQVAQSLAVDDLEPVLAARIEDVDLDVDPARQAAQDVQVERRQGGQAKDAGTGGQAGQRRCVGAEVRDFLEKRGRRVLPTGAEFGRDASPESGLPRLVFIACGVQPRDACTLAIRPGSQPLWPIGNVLLDQLRTVLRQIQSHHRVGIAKVARQRWVTGAEAVVAEDLEYPPRQQFRREGRHILNVDQVADLCPQPLREIGKLDVGADPLAVGAGQFDAAPYRGARNDHLLRGERRACFIRQAVEQAFQQEFEAVGQGEPKHGDGFFRLSGEHYRTRLR